MSSSIELINPKAESIRRAAALQVSGLSFLLSIVLIFLPGQHQWSHGARERSQRESRSVARSNDFPLIFTALQDPEGP